MLQVELSPDVLKIINESGKVVGKFRGELFNEQLFCDCLEREIRSPIEQILYCALQTIREVNFLSDAEPCTIQGKEVVLGLGIWPQRKIGNYQIDFVVDHNQMPPLPTKEILVECDSQQFHERTEQERRYEKARDRFLIRNGYTVFHYTGKEIMENPYKIACEIVAFVTERKKEDLYKAFSEYK